jgi:predicted RNase H-like nuclease (RuvC/YqgF family)
MLQTFGIPFDQTPTNFPQHHKELVAQLNSAKKIADDKAQHTTDVQARAEQFKSLFAEGVISKRELENAQSEADASTNELNDAKLKVSSLQSALTRLEERMSASNKTGAGKGAKGHQANNKKVAQKKAVQADASKATNRLPRPTSDKAHTLVVTDKTTPHNAVATKTTTSAAAGNVAGSSNTIKSATANSAPANTATSTTTAISSSKPVAPVTSDQGKKPLTLPSKSGGDAVKDSIE